MSMIFDKSLILNKIKLHYGFDSDAEFARFLEIPATTLSSWYKRNTFDVNLIYAKCVDVSGDFIISGKEPMLRQQGSYALETTINFESKVPQVVTIDSHAKDNVVLVPYTLKAGYIKGYNDPKFIQKLPSYRLPGLNNGVFRMFEAEGNSMFPTIPSKSFAIGQFVENWSKDIKDNQIYAVISNEVEDGLLKRVVNRIDKYNNLLCKSDNRRNYPNQNIDPKSVKEIWHIKAAMVFDFPDPADIYDRLNDLEANYQQIMKIISVK
ncbi:helix-turn-helix domain-containing protein [Chryseobacterium sp.]|uniref:LexA family transcriptional regulator n=1 Tax=Chryseobacterium sp. TaxID=1871047 RepID=UPI0031D741FE